MSSIERNEKEIIVNNKPLVIKELTINEMNENAEIILEFFEAGQQDKLNLKNREFFYGLLLKIGPAFTNWEGKDFLDMAPSQIKKLLPFFQEVNEDFLLILDSFGITQKLKIIQQAMRVEVEKIDPEKDIVSQENENNSEQN